MASTEVTGRTESGVEELRQEYRQKFDGEPETPFEETRCLSPIPRQPDSYDGPQRFCVANNYLSEVGDVVRCKHHGGNAEPHPENMEPTANMSHGMHATQENLQKDFDEKDQALYDWILEEWPDAYGIDFEDEPAAKHDMHRLAVEIVRAERGRGYLIEEGEVSETEVYGDDGVVIDSSGEVVTEKSEHYLAQMLHRQDKKITDLEKELGISRKEQLRQDSTDDAVEAIKNFTELGSAFIQRDEKEYDPDSEPWTDE
jgi:hypothetical protein